MSFVGKTARNASIQIFAQLVMRVFTFISNAFVVRSVGPIVLGVGLLQLELLFTGVLVFVRDGIRKAAYRCSVPTEFGEKEATNTRINLSPSQRSMLNMCWLFCLPSGFLVACAASWVFIRWPKDGVFEAITEAEYQSAILLTLVGVVVALFSEPLHLVAQDSSLQHVRASVETLATVAKCLSTLSYVIFFKGSGVIAFGAGNLAYATALLGGYGWYFVFRRNMNVVTFLPRRLVSVGPARPWYEPSIGHTTTQMTLNNVLKWFLEQGENIVMVWLGTAEQGGAYAVVTNLGSIIVRLLFQPVEERSLAAFGELENGNKRQPLFRLFSLLINILLKLGLVFVCFGPPFSHLLLHILYGERWSSVAMAPRLLSWYCVYILVLALNGVCEALVQGSASQRDLRSYNFYVVVFSISFLLSLVVLVHYGPVGMIVANLAKMGCRICVCMCVFIHPFFKTHLPEFSASSWRVVLPSSATVAALFASVAVLRLSNTHLWGEGVTGFFSHQALNGVLHIFVGVCCLLVASVVTYVREGRQLVSLYRSIDRSSD